MRKSNQGFTLVEMVVVVAVLVLLFAVANTLYVGSARQGRLTDEHATAAEHAAVALESVLADLRQMAVRPKPQPLSEAYRLSNDKRSIALLRSEPRVGGTSAAESASLVTFQLDTSSRGTGNYIMKRLQEMEDGTKTERALPGIVLRDVRYDAIEQDSRNFLRVTVTALARDEDLTKVAPELAPKTYSASSLFEVRQPEAPAAFTAGLPAVNALAAATPPAVPAPAPGQSPDPSVPQVPIEKPSDVTPPPVARQAPRVPSGDSNPPAEPAPATPEPASPEPPPAQPPAPPAQPAPANPWVATGVPAALRQPIQKMLDSIRDLYGDDYRSKIRGNVWGSFSVTHPDGTRKEGSFSENYTIDFTGKGGVDPARQIERILDRMAKISEHALAQFFRQHGVSIDDDVLRSIRESVGA